MPKTSPERYRSRPRAPVSASLVVVLLSGALPALADEEPAATEKYRGKVVRDVRLEFGDQAPPEASISLVALKPGEAYRPESVRRSVKQLFALGAFSDVKVEAFAAGVNEVDVLFRLFPRLEVQEVTLLGLELGGPELEKLRSELVQETGLEPGDPLDVADLETATQKLETRLRNEGFLWAQVEPEASFQSPSAVVVFHVEPGTHARVGTLAIEGVAPHVEAHVLRELQLPEGALYSRNDLDRRIEKLQTDWSSLGYYAAKVTVEESLAADSRVDVRLRPEIGPKVRIEVEGWDFSEKELRELVPLFDEARFTGDLVEESRANIEESVQELGYRDASVVVERESTGDESYLLIRFRVDAGPRYEIRAIEIEGLHSVPEADVRALLVTRSRRRVRSAPFRPQVWNDDLRAVGRYLEKEGFHQAVVESRARVDVDEPDLLTLVIKVEEGPRALVGSVELTGAREIPPASVLAAARIAPGEPFARAEVVEARERILTFYRNEGFRAVEAEARLSLDSAGEAASVTFALREGERTRVEQVIFSGLRVTRESAVRQLVTFGAGDPLSTIAVTETRQRLIGSGLFRRVDIEALPADPVTGRSNVLVTVEEGPRTTFAYGFGYEEQQLARAEIEVTRRNLFGLNRTVSVFTRASFRGGRFITTYRQPDFFGADLPAFVSAYAEEEERTSFDYNRVGVGLQLSKKITANQHLFWRYRFDQTKVFRLEVDIEDIDRRFRNTRISALSMASVTDRRDDPLNPRGGQFRILDIEWSAEALGTGAPYLKGLAQQFFYFALPKDMVAAVGLRLGVGETLRSDRDALLPIAERFFAGGANTLRGFALDEASPKEKIPLPNGEVVDGDPIGGNVLSLVNLELRFPILGNLRGVVFSDNGTVYRRLEIIELLNWRYNLGFGFRYDTPLGPLRVDYGFKLDRRTVRSIDCPNVLVPCQEPFGRWHVSLGHAF
jgi:outer membrane protein assembly complex protein YaeT